MIFPTISLRIERWKFNKEYGIYVSTLGNFKDRYKRRLPIKINQGGYCLVKTETPNLPWKLAHRVVMLTWKPIPDAENLTVDHLNHNKRDNSITNLEWVTAKENKRRAKEDFLSEKTGSCNLFSKKCPIEKYREAIEGVKINDTLFPLDAEVIWNHIIATYYPGGYPKDVIQQAVKNYWDRVNVGKKRIGKKCLMELVFKESEINV